MANPFVKASQPGPTFSFTSSSVFAPTGSTIGTSFAFGNTSSQLNPSGAKWVFNSSSKPPEPSVISAMPLAPLVTLGPSSQIKELDELKTKLAATESENVVLQDKKQASDEACQRLQIDMKTAKEEFCKELDELKRKLAVREGENLVLQDMLHACDAKTAEVPFSKEFDEMKRKLAAMESENVMLQDKKQASDEACQRLQNDVKTEKEEFSKELDEMKRKLAATQSENLVLHDKVQASHEATSKVEFNKEFDEMTRKLAATEFENVALRDKLRDMVEAYQKVQNHINATGALIYHVVKSEAWAAYKTTTAMDGTNMVVLHAITAMPQYEQKSFEELRLEYYIKASNISAALS